MRRAATVHATGMAGRPGGIEAADGVGGGAGEPPGGAGEPPRRAGEPPRRAGESPRRRR